MELVCFQGADNESWGQIKALVRKGDWNNVFVIKNKDSESLDLEEKCEEISVDSGKSLIELKREIIEKLRDRLGKEFEVALSIASGNGKEHMALISALLGIPVGIRLVAFTKKGVEFVN